LLGYDAALYKKTKLENPLVFSDYAEVAKDLVENAVISEGKYEEYLMEGGYFDLLFEGGDEEDEISYCF